MSNKYGFTISINVPPLVNYFEDTRDSYFSALFSGYPEESFDSFDVSCTIRDTAKNGYLVYAILEAFPAHLYSIDKNRITVSITDQDTFCSYYSIVWDLLNVIRTWSTLCISYNSIQIDVLGFQYLCSHILGRNNEIAHLYGETVKDLHQKYFAKKRLTTNEKKKSAPVVQIRLCNNDRDGIIPKVLRCYVNQFCKGLSFEKHQITKHEIVLVLEDTYIVDFRAESRSFEHYGDSIVPKWSYPCVIIQELTPNNLFRFYQSKFKSLFYCDNVSIEFLKFHGVHYYEPRIDHTNFVDKALPHLKLSERCSSYEGENYHFIILRMEDPTGTIVHGVSYTQEAVHSFILKLCKELEEKNSRTLIASGATGLPFSENKDFIKAFLSWTGKKKRWRLENKFSYYCEDRLIKNDTLLQTLPKELLVFANQKPYSGELGYYSKPLNRWKNEELVYNITKRLYKDYQVIYQYRPYYLSTKAGNMSYDIYICGLRVAIEYQGQQHFEPVEYFGGLENHEKQKQRDALKAERSKENGVHLVYVYYWESITPELIKNKVEQSLQQEE